jgi:hypothetical protein
MSYPLFITYILPLGGHSAAAVKAAVEGCGASIEPGSFLADGAVTLLVKHHTALVPTLAPSGSSAAPGVRALLRLA